MYVCIQSNTTQGSLYYYVLIAFKLHVSAFFHRAIIRLIYVRCFLYKCNCVPCEISYYGLSLGVHYTFVFIYLSYL
jgi:hypothetical protein